MLAAAPKRAADCQTLPEPCSSRPAETKSLGRSNNFKTDALTSQSAASESHDTQS